MPTHVVPLFIKLALEQFRELIEIHEWKQNRQSPIERSMPMLDEEKLDENHPFIPSSPTTTASDLRRIVEEIQERKRLLDKQLLAVLPNLVASDVLKSCEDYARGELCSGTFQMSNPVLVGKLPSPMKASYDENGDLLSSCARIRERLGEMVQGILTHLDFKCQATVVDNVLKIEISW